MSDVSHHALGMLTIENCHSYDGGVIRQLFSDPPLLKWFIGEFGASGCEEETGAMRENG